MPRTYSLRCRAPNQHLPRVPPGVLTSGTRSFFKRDLFFLFRAGPSPNQGLAAWTDTFSLMPRNPRAASLPTVRKAGGELTEEARMAIVVDYEAFSQGVRTKFASVKALALHHKVYPKYPAKIHKKWKESGTVKTAERSGQPTKWTKQKIKQLEKAIQKQRKSSCGKLAVKVGMSKDACWKKRKTLGYKPIHTIQRPLLNEHHKKARVEYATANGDDDHDRIFEADIDESWKYGGGFKRPGYYKKGEEVPVKSLGRKNDPDKVMYIACVGNSKGKGAKVALEPCEQTKELRRGD